jgi:hypothetical protein
MQGNNKRKKKIYREKKKETYTSHYFLVRVTWSLGETAASLALLASFMTACLQRRCSALVPVH